MTERIEFHRDGEWTAVYLDGHLERVGDHYLAEEWLAHYYGVKVVDDNAFMRGQDKRDGVAQTLDEVRAYAVERDTRLAKSAELRQRAGELLAEAERMEQP